MGDKVSIFGAGFWKGHAVGTLTKHTIIQLDEFLQQALARPRIPLVVLARQASFGEINAHSLRPGSETATNVLLALMHQIVFKFLLGVSFHGAVQGI